MFSKEFKSYHDIYDELNLWFNLFTLDEDDSSMTVTIEKKDGHSVVFEFFFDHSFICTVVTEAGEKVYSAFDENELARAFHWAELNEGEARFIGAESE